MDFGISPSSGYCGFLGSSSYPFGFSYINQIIAEDITTDFFYLTSDERKKENIKPIKDALKVITKMEGKTFDFKTERYDSIKNRTKREKLIEKSKNHAGFIAQDVVDILPEAVYHDKENDDYYIDYIAIIPYLVEAMKEQQTKIETLEAEIEALQGNAKEKSATIDDTTPASLEQNIPNPFTTNTTIKMYVPATVTKAVLYIYNMEGMQIKQLTITGRGNTSATIEGHALQAGMYLYTLISDGKEVDTKKMILTK